MKFTRMKKESFKYYKFAADNGNIEAMYRAALMLDKGVGVNEDKKRSFQLL